MTEMDKDTIVYGDDDTILPDGYVEGDDIFDQESWTGEENQADEPGDPTRTDDDQVSTSAADEGAPTTEHPDEPGAADEGSEQTPTPETDPVPSDKKLKFKARVDRADLDVEVDESDLPTLYQKAQVTDRVQAKLAKLAPQVEQAERLAKSMGYGSVEEMLSSAESNYRDNEIARLVAEGVHQELAADIVSRRMGDSDSGRSSSDTHETQSGVDAAGQEHPGAQATERDFRAEVQDLLRVRQDLVGTEIPNEVVQDCVQNGTPLLAAYLSYEAKQAKAENERLSKKLKVMEQNAAAAARSPVSGVTGGGPTDTKPQDDFLRGFESDDF